MEELVMHVSAASIETISKNKYSCFVEKASDSKKRIAFVGNHWGPQRSCGRILSLGIVVGMPTEHGITWKTHWEAKISASKDAGRDGFGGSQLEKSFQSLEIIYGAGRTCNSTSEFSREWVTWWELWLWSRGCFRNMSGIMTIVLACVCFQLKDVEWHEYVRSRDQPATFWYANWPAFVLTWFILCNSWAFDNLVTSMQIHVWCMLLP